MTTDRYAKIRSRQIGSGRLVLICKGAGMVEPHLATMLIFILSDLNLDETAARRITGKVADETFNRLSIDGEQSTSDSLLLLSSGAAGAVDEEIFAAALHDVCHEAAQDIVRNGEGVSHLIKCRVSGANNNEEAVYIARRIVNSSLIKTAVCGNDPNVGRIYQSIGDSASRLGIDLDQRSLSISLGDEAVYRNGTFIIDEKTELRLNHYLQQRAFDSFAAYPTHEHNVEISVNLAAGSGTATVIGGDLTDHYIRINADYRS